MTQLDLFANDDDFLELVDHALLANGALFLADVSYDDPKVALLADLRDMIALRRKARRFFFCAGPDVEIVLKPHPAESKAGQYYIPPRVGGPFLLVTASPVFKENRKQIIGAGSILMYPSYFVVGVDGPAEKKVDAKTRSLFQMVRKYVVKRSCNSRPKGFHVLPRAAAAAAAGNVDLEAGGSRYELEDEECSRTVQ